MQTTSPRNGAPKTDAPKTDAPKVDAPQADAPKTDAPKVDAPQADAPKTDAPQADAPKVLDIDSDIESEEIEQAARIYKDVSPRLPMADGSVAAVQREIRANGTLGAFEGAIIRKNRNKGETVRRFDLSEVKEWRKVMRATGIKVLGD